MPTYGDNLNINGRQLLNAGLQQLSSDPESPFAGQLWINMTSGLPKMSNGTSVLSVYPATNANTAGTVVLRDGSGNFAAAVGTFTSVTIGGTPTNPTDAATKAYVDALVQGLQIKPDATVATTTTLPTYTYANGTSGVGATITFSGMSTITIDGHDLAAGDTVLVKNEGTAANNGLYLCTQAANGTVGTILTRHVDMDQAAEFSGAFVPVTSAGTVNPNTLWLCNPSGAVTVGTTSIPFTQINSAVSLTAGSGISISGQTISVDSGYVGQTSIDTVGTITAGVWQGTTIAIAYGGTGATTAAAARGNLGAPGVSKGSITGTGSATSFSYAHGLTSQQVQVSVQDADYNPIEIDWAPTTSSVVTLTIQPAPGSGVVYYVTVVG